jgi:hypothetical protein
MISFKTNINNNVMAGGPTCTNNNQVIPCYEGCSPNASITSKRLADMLRVIVCSGIFYRTDGATPFLLLDGHHSRFGLLFLEYIHDDNHKWTCCFVVPYGTHIWQVVDSNHMNGIFKLVLTTEKRELLSFQTKGTSRFVQSDVIPLVKKGWAESFAKKEKAKTAFSQRRWNPLNYKILDHPNVNSSTLLASSSQRIPDSDKSVAINSNGKQFPTYLQQFILNEAKKEGRKRMLEE